MADYQFIGNASGDFAGWTIAPAGDVDGDGRSDVIVAAPEADGGASRSGQTYLITAAALSAADQADINADGVIDLGRIDGLDGVYRFFGSGLNDLSGAALSSAGDVDGDGLDDLVIAASGSDAGGGRSGEVYLIPAASLVAADQIDGSVDGVIDLSQVNGAQGAYRFVGAESSDFAGSSISATGDVDGDGRNDLIIGAVSANGGGRNSGEAYLIAFADIAAADRSDGLEDGVVSLANVADQPGSFRLIGAAISDAAGRAVAIVGDVDGDGLDDVAIGAPGADGSEEASGEVYLVAASDLRTADLYDGADDGVIDLGRINSAVRSYQFIGGTTGDGVGQTVVPAGDVDGDGRNDLLISAPFAEAGEAYLVVAADVFQADVSDGVYDGVIDLAGIADQPGSYRFVGAEIHDGTGFSIATPGDFDGDGFDDILIGASGSDAEVRNAGAAYLIAAADLAAADLADGTVDGVIDLAQIDELPGSYRFLGVAAGDLAGRSVGSAGDVDGDGRADLLIGAPSANTNGSAAGAAYLLTAANLEIFDAWDGQDDNSINLGAAGVSYLRQDGDGPVADDLKDGAGAQIFQMANDGVRDLIRAFERGIDVIDVSAFAADFTELTLTNLPRGDGSTAWIQIVDSDGDTELLLRFGDGSPLDAGVLSANDFVFAEPDPVLPFIDDSNDPTRDDLSGGIGGQIFRMADDGVQDLIRDFEPGVDLIDISSFSADIGDLTIRNLHRRDGSVSWVEIRDSVGDVEFVVRFGGDLPPDDALLTSESFIFGEQAIPPRIVADLDGSVRDDLTGGFGAQIFQMVDDGVRDLIRDFQPGVDLIDVSMFSGDFGDLTIENLYRRDGSVSWVQISDENGDAEMVVRFGGDTPPDAALLTEADFLVI